MSPPPPRDLARAYRAYLDRAHERLEDWIERDWNPWVDLCDALLPHEWPPQPGPPPRPSLEEFAEELGISPEALQRRIRDDPALRRVIDVRIADLQGARMLIQGCVPS